MGDDKSEDEDEDKSEDEVIPHLPSLTFAAWYVHCSALLSASVSV